MAQDIAEAERRIEAVRRERGDSLDLSGLRLRAVPDGVADLTWLRKLELNDNWLSELPESLASLDGLTYLDLADNWLPEVPGWIAGLRDLTWLDLDDNKIIEVPGWIGGLTGLTHLGLNCCDLDTVPEWIANLTRLTELGLGDNFLREIPEWLGGFSKLTRLQLYGNRLRTLPESLDRLNKLTRLDIDGNRLTEVPEWIGSLDTLTSLDLGDNQFTNIPSWLGNLSTLTRIDLCRSRLTEVPSWLANLTGLTELYLEYNWLTEIPEWFGDLSELTELRLNGNRLRTLPESLAHLTKLTGLDIDNNHLTEIPQWIGQLTDLTGLDLGNNQFVQIPEWLGGLTGLTRLGLNNSRLAKIPEWVAGLSSLTHLKLNDNRLAEIPEWVGGLSELTTLRLDGNRLRALPESLTHLTKLTHLDIEGNQLADLPAWIGQLTDLTWLDLTGNQFCELHDGLRNLTNLRYLTLPGCKLATLPCWFENFTELTSLHLADNELAEIPGVLGNLDRLETLSLSGNNLTALPSWLGQCRRITSLYLNDNRFGELPNVIRSLTRVRSLTLKNTGLSALPAWLASLPRLSELDVGGNQISQLPAELGTLTWLSRIDLSDNKFTGIPEWIGGLTSLEFLGIAECGLTEVPPWIGRLANLTFLNLSGNSLSFLPEPLVELTDLQFLLLIDTGVNKLPDWIGRLTRITWLSASGNNLTELPYSLGNLDRLSNLFLYNNNLTNIPPSLARLKSLKVLDLSNNKLAEAPDWLLDLPDLENLYLGGNQAMISPPPEIAASGTESVLAFLRARREGATRQWVSKLLVVGEGGVGKTSLIKALIGMEHDPAEETTHGIRVNDLLLQHPDEPDVRMKLSTWDFGGQQIYHATHQFFLSDRSLFLLLWNARLGWEQGRLRYWLDIIKSRAPESPVLLIATHADASQRPVDLPIDDLRREYPQIVGNLKADNETRRGLGDVRDKLARQAADLPLMGTEWPTTWLNAAGAVKSYPENHITPERMWQLMSEAGVTDSDQQQYIAVAMHQLGDILYYDDDPELVQTVVLKPEWVNGYISEVLDSTEVDNAHGLLTRTEMTRLWAGLDRGMRDHFLGMMDKYEISFRVADEPGGVVSLVVERLPWNAPSYADIWDEARDVPGTSEIRVIYQLNTTPPGIPTWFIARSHRFTMNVHWRNGAVLRHPDGKHIALIRANPGRNTVELTVRGPMPPAFFSVLDDGFNRTLERYPGLEIKRLVPCRCEDDGGCTELFEYDDLQRRLQREPPKHEIECRKSGEDINVLQLLHGIAPSDRDILRAGIERLEKKLDGQHEYNQRYFLKVLRVLQDQQEVRCPSVFSLAPVRHRVTGTRLRLRLYCEEPGAWHPLPDDAGCYEVNEAADWLQKIKPHLTTLLTILKHAAPLAGPVLGMTVAHMSECMKAEVQTMTELVSQIPEPSRIPDPLDKDELRRDPGVSDRAGNDADFRALEALLLKLDPAREWGGLSRTVTPEGLTLYLCREHSETYRRAVRL